MDDIKQKILNGLDKGFKDVDGAQLFITDRIKEEILNNIFEEFENDNK